MKTSQLLYRIQKVIFPSIILLFTTFIRFAGAQENVSIILSSNLEPYMKASDAFKKHLREQNSAVQISEYEISGKNKDSIYEQINNENSRVVFVIGTSALNAAKEKLKNKLLIYAMLIDYQQSANENSTGIILDASADVKIKEIKSILPGIKKIGVIYSKNFEYLNEEIARSCEKYNIQLVSREIKSQNELSGAFESISNDIDCLLMIPDYKIYSPLAVKYLLKESLIRRIPVLGISSIYTEAGALLSFDFDYSDIGSQAGEIAGKILSGTKPNDITPQRPRKVRYTLNLLAAERLNIHLSSTVVKNAQKVYGK